MNVLHSCSGFGVAHADGVALVKFGFLNQVTLTERPLRANHMALCSYVGSCEVTDAARG